MPVTGGLQHFNHVPATKDDMKFDANRPDLTLGVLGTGAMGRGIVQVAAAGGINVLMMDTRAGAAEEAREFVAKMLARAAEKGSMSKEDAAAAAARIKVINTLAEFKPCHAIVEAVVENAGHDLRPGMFVTAKLALGEQSLPAVPETAVRADGTLRHVFVAQGGRLEDRLVQAAEPQNGQVPILSGLKAGEPVVADLTPDVRDGARVK